MVDVLSYANGSPLSTWSRRRRSVRRAVTVACNVRCDLWDGPVLFHASNLSADGMWLETPVQLRMGEELLVSFTPPGEFVKLHALCEVKRLGCFRRASDPAITGMGVVFTDLSQADRKRLSTSLVGRPPPLPWRVRLRAGVPRMHAHAYSSLALPVPRPSLPALLEQRTEEHSDAPTEAPSPLRTRGRQEDETLLLPIPEKVPEEVKG